MKIYHQTTVWDAALERMRFIFDEFPVVIVGCSGGKDSTVTLNLALKVAEEKGRLPLPVVFIDQEAEWQSVIDYVTTVMEDPRVTPYWFQMPLRLFNSASTTDTWLKCWDPGAEWIRDKWHGSIKENVYGSDRFGELFTRIIKHHWPEQKACYLAGVRCEESPARMMGLTSAPTYKHITYGKVLHKTWQQYTFYPIYDWSYTDVWKAIHANKWPYCQIYDYMYQQGVPILKMRVSNVHHETSLASLFYLQEIEGDTWNKLTKRISGISTAGQLNVESFFIGKDLPYMFASWEEYRDYLVENLLTDEDVRVKFRTRIQRMDIKYAGIHHKEEMIRIQINSILTNDYHFTKLTNWERRPEVNGWRIWKKGKKHPEMATNRYIVG